MDPVTKIKRTLKELQSHLEQIVEDDSAQILALTNMVVNGSVTSQEDREAQIVQVLIGMQTEVTGLLATAVSIVECLDNVQVALSTLD